MKKERIKYFDVIKLIAAVTVFICHFTRSLEYVNITYKVKILPDWPFSIYLGGVGVTLFFIISGAALMYVYDEKLDLKQYYIKRFKGIYPMFWIAFVVFFLINYYINKGFDNSIPKWKIIYSVLGIDGPMLSISPNFFSAGEWFLGVIVVLYILFPVFRKLLIRYSWKFLIFTLLIGIGIDLMWTSNYPINNFFVVRIPEFVFGMYFVKYIKRSNMYISIVSLYILILFSFFEFSYIKDMTRVYIVGFSLFFVLVWMFQNIECEFIVKISKFVSKYIYPIFLTHHQLQIIFLKHFQGKELMIADVYILCLSTIILTLVSSYVLDKVTNLLTGGSK